MGEREALEVLAGAGRQIVAGVKELLPGWVEDAAMRVVDAWERHSPAERDGLRLQAREAGAAAAQRIAGELEALFALGPDEQRVTPVQLIRTAYVEPSVVLERADIPPVVRDEFEERSLPADVYGLAPRTLADLGSEGLADAHLAWGAAKARVHKARRG